MNESTVELLDAWRLFDINGGCLSAVALRSALASTDHDRPISISCHFLTRAATGPARVVTRPLRRGPRADAVETTIEQDGTPVLTAVTWAGSRCDGLAHDDATMPDAPGPEYLATYGQGDEPPPMWFPIYDLLEEKPVVPVDEAFLNEVRRPIYQGWFRDKGRFQGPDPVRDAARSLVYLDLCFGGVVGMPYAGLPPYLYTTMHLTVDFHAHEASEWLLVEARSPVAKDGPIWAGGTVWSRDGSPLATASSHLLSVPWS